MKVSLLLRVLVDLAIVGKAASHILVDWKLQERVWNELVKIGNTVNPGFSRIDLDNREVHRAAREYAKGLFPVNIVNPRHDKLKIEKGQNPYQQFVVLPQKERKAEDSVLTTSDEFYIKMALFHGYVAIGIACVHDYLRPELQTLVVFSVRVGASSKRGINFHRFLLTCPGLFQESIASYKDSIISRASGSNWEYSYKTDKRADELVTKFSIFNKSTTDEITRLSENKNEMEAYSYICCENIPDFNKDLTMLESTIEGFNSILDDLKKQDERAIIKASASVRCIEQLLWDNKALTLKPSGKFCLIIFGRFDIISWETQKLEKRLSKDAGVANNSLYVHARDIVVRRAGRYKNKNTMPEYHLVEYLLGARIYTIPEIKWSKMANQIGEKTIVGFAAEKVIMFVEGAIQVGYIVVAIVFESNLLPSFAETFGKIHFSPELMEVATIRSRGEKQTGTIEFDGNQVPTLLFNLHDVHIGSVAVCFDKGESKINMKAIQKLEIDLYSTGILSEPEKKNYFHIVMPVPRTLAPVRIIKELTAKMTTKIHLPTGKKT